MKGKVRFGPPKTKAAPRTITVPQTLVDELAAHLAAYPPAADGLVFTAPEGGPLRLTNWRRRTWDPGGGRVGGPADANP